MRIRGRTMKFEKRLKKLVFDSIEEAFSWVDGLKSVKNETFTTAAKDSLNLSVFDLYVQDEEIGFCMITGDINSLKDGIFYYIKLSSLRDGMSDGCYLVTKGSVYGN